MVLYRGHSNLFNTMSQYLTLNWFKVVFLYHTLNAYDISCPLSPLFDKHSSNWLYKVGRWHFSEVSDCLKTILSHLEIKLDL